MPTYRNDGSVNIYIKDTVDALITLKPGDTIQSYEIRTDSGLTKTADTPYYNPLVDRHSETSTGVGDDQTVELDVSNTSYIKVWKVTGGPVSVFFQAKVNTPAVAVLRAGDSFVTGIKKNVGQLILEFAAAGTCEVLEAREGLS